MKTALLLEDMPESQEMLREVAQTAFPGIRVNCAADVSSALELIQRFEFDLALIDIHMPFSPIDGIEVLKRIRDIDKNANCIMATRIHDEESIDNAKRIVADNRGATRKNFQQISEILGCPSARFTCSGHGERAEP